MNKIVIVGGGAGGMELLGKIGRRLGKGGKAEITLVDRCDHHIWKPLLHELATGSLDEGLNAVDYRVHGSHTGYKFEQGELAGLDRENRKVILAPMYDSKGEEILPIRELDYDYLVLGIGAVTNDFRIPGVAEHCQFLDLTEQAMALRSNILTRFLRYAKQPDHDHFEIAIVGSGATGVEMAAEMHHAADTLRGYGYEIRPDLVKVTLVEAADTVMPALEQKPLQQAVDRQLRALDVNIQTNTLVTQVEPDALLTRCGQRIPADLMIWAAGVKAPEVLTQLGLQTNTNNQVKVQQNCRSIDDPRIFAFGDCAECPQPDGSYTPPRGQTARQMALLIGSHLIKLQQDPDAELTPYLYQNLGGFVNMSKFHTVGNMFTFIKGGVNIHGWPARFVYNSLYRRHMLALHGPVKGLFMLALNGLQRWIRPEMKIW